VLLSVTVGVSGGGVQELRAQQRGLAHVPVGTPGRTPALHPPRFRLVPAQDERGRECRHLNLQFFIPSVTVGTPSRGVAARGQAATHRGPGTTGRDELVHLLADGVDGGEEAAAQLEHASAFLQLPHACLDL